MELNKQNLYRGSNEILNKISRNRDFHPFWLENRSKSNQSNCPRTRKMDPFGSCWADPLLYRSPANDFPANWRAEVKWTKEVSLSITHFPKPIQSPRPDLNRTWGGKTTKKSKKRIRTIGTLQSKGEIRLIIDTCGWKYWKSSQRIDNKI